MSKIKILISGDFCPIGRTGRLLNEGAFSSVFNGFEKLVATVDYAIVNLECPVTLSDRKIEKTGPCIKTENTEALRALQFAGFNLLTLANNHILDYDEQGVIDTVENAKKFGFATIGAGKNIEEAKKPVIKDLKGIKIGFINIAENEFCAADHNAAGAHTLDLIGNLKEIADLRTKVDKVILIYHGGREHYQLPSPNQRKTFRFLIENGVDAIVAHHTHCVSGFEYYDGKPIVYSLGNFIFDYKEKYQRGNWTEGMSVVLHLEDDSFKVQVIPHFQGRKSDPTLHLLKDNDHKIFVERVENLNRVITDDHLFKNEWQSYLASQEKFYLSSLYIKNIYIRFLFIKGIFPISLLRSKHNKLILNLIRCEAHHEITKDILSAAAKKNY
ncbi:CapA family protein [Kaistella faecalis]|uniref:CapA family protein n=1 Tax=Kaistella faecalis TaxID=2852098 RepID=UPI001C48FDCE|nr:CapA family protein [Chryseobacterium faecale]UFK97101.1 CapA family protein [Chryseobacterium faecale]